MSSSLKARPASAQGSHTAPVAPPSPGWLHKPRPQLPTPRPLARPEEPHTGQIPAGGGEAWRVGVPAARAWLPHSPAQLSTLRAPKLKCGSRRREIDAATRSQPRPVLLQVPRQSRRESAMATPPKRLCPSPSTSSEGTRIKKISIEGNIGKAPLRYGCLGVPSQPPCPRRRGGSCGPAPAQGFVRSALGFQTPGLGAGVLLP